MASNYPSFRHSLPWLILSLQVVFIILFYFFFSSADNEPSSIISYPAFQDVNLMVVFGFAFSFAFLRRFGFSSIAFNLLLVVLGVQCSVLIEDLLLFLLHRANEDGLKRITKATVSMSAVLISTGAVLGKMNPVQLILMTVVEMIAFHLNRWLHTTFLQVPGSINMRHVYLFGAYFGLAASSRFSEPSPRCEKSRSTPKSDLFSVLGAKTASPSHTDNQGERPLEFLYSSTLFLWVFWPSFNAVLAEVEKSKAVYNTYFALAASTVIAFLLSALTTREGKFHMAHIHSAVLAGGVAVGSAAPTIEYPWIAMILGLLASVISILGSYCLQRCFNPPLKIHDTSGVHFTFGLPAVLGALAQIVLLVIQNWTALPRLDYLVWVHVGALCLSISVALIGGFITGLILNFKLFKNIPASKYFEDQLYWEFPHLAVGF